MNSDIKIRQMKQKDFTESALIMSHAFSSKFPALTKFSTGEISDFMLAGGVFHENNLNGHYVAIEEDKVVGILHLESYETKKNTEKTPIKSRYLIRKFGLFRSLISGISMFFLYHSVSKGELTVDFIAVHPDFRGRGVGGKLLDFGENQARQTDGISRYTLGVIEKNIGARRLYERKGFCVVKSRKQYIARLFTGVKKHHKMAKDLCKSQD